MYTIDASVRVSALNSAEPNSGSSQALLSLSQQPCVSLFSPTLLPLPVPSVTQSEV